MKQHLLDFATGFVGFCFLAAAYMVAGSSDYEQEKQIEERVCELYPHTVDYCREG